MPPKSKLGVNVTKLAETHGVSAKSVRLWIQQGLQDFSKPGVLAFRELRKQERGKIVQAARKWKVSYYLAKKHVENGTAPIRRVKIKVSGSRQWTSPSTQAVWYLAEMARDLKSFPDWGVLWDQQQKKIKEREYDATKWSETPREKRDQINARIREYRKTEEAKAKRREYKRKRYDQSPELRIQDSLRARLRKFADGKTSRGVASLIGCSWDEFRAHLQRQFKPGMSWQNYGSNWHIDHIIPCSKFDHSDHRQVKQCWHFTNLRPLSVSENLRKGAKIEAPQLSLLLNT